MATPDLVLFLAPEFAYMDFGVIRQALLLAEDYRPTCLTGGKGDQAVALYAAWLLSLRNTSTNPSTSVTGVVGPLIMEQEGDLKRQYALPQDGAVSSATNSDYKARFDALAKLCGYGAILTRFSGEAISAELPGLIGSGSGYP